MSDKPLRWNGDAHLAEGILAALRRRSPLKAKEIAQEMMVTNNGRRPYVNAINKVLRGYLANDVVQIDGGRWALRSP